MERYKELLKEEWIDNGVTFAELEILTKGDEMILFDKKKDDIYLRFKIDKSK